MQRKARLSDEEVRQLEVQHRSAPTDRVRARCEMILLAHQGLSPAQISNRMPYARSTVVRFLDRYEAEGVNGLLDRPRPGRPRRVTEDYEARLLQVARLNPADMGLPHTHWTTARLADFMAEETGIRITARQVENYLKAHGIRLRRRRRPSVS
jgi:transposase